MSTGDNKDSELSFPDFGKFAAAASGLALVLSVLYDYCFLLALGLSLAEVPTTIADHVRSAIIWAPAVLGVFLGGNLIGVFLAWTGAIEKAGADVPRQARTLQNISHYHFKYAPPSIIVLAAFLHFSMFIFIGALILVGWILFGPILLNGVQRRANIGFGVWTSIYALVTLGVYVCQVGYHRGAGLRDGDTDKWVLTTKDGNGTKTITGVGIRRFSDNILLVDQDRRVRVVPASDVVSASRVEVTPHSRSVACEYLNVYCQPIPRDREPAGSGQPAALAASSAPPTAPSSPTAASR